MCGESRTHGSGRGGRKRAGDSTSPAAYSTFITAAPPDILATRLNTVRYEQLIRKPFTLDEILTTVHRYIAS